MKRLKAVFSIFILSLFMVNYATEPLPPPYCTYRVNGEVVCDTMIDKSNYTIALFGKHMSYQLEYEIVNEMYYGNEKIVSLTDSSGNYYLVVNSYVRFDSLRIGWVRPHLPVVFSKPYFVDKSKMIEVIERYQKNSSGCSSCSSVEPDETRIVRYEYNQLDTELNVCNK